MEKIFGFVVIVLVMSFANAPVVFADAEQGKKLFNLKATKCKICHKAQGDPSKFKPVGPGLKGVGKRHSREWLQKYLSPANKELWDAKGPDIQDIMARFKAAKKGKEMKKSQMVKSFAPGKGGKPPKIQLTDEERNHIIDYLMTL